MNTKDKATKRGMNYISAGKLNGNETEQRKVQVKMTEILRNIKAGSLENHFEMYKSYSFLSSAIGIPVLADYFVHHNHIQQWNIVVLDYILLFSLPCIFKNSNVSVVSMTNYLVQDIQPWTLPRSRTGLSHNLTFRQRFSLFLQLSLTKFFRKFIVNLPEFYLGSEVTRRLCKEVFNFYPHEGWEYPLIITTMMGLEYPRTVSPMAHYVGPVLSQSAINQPLPEDISQWLQDKKEHSVIYISMGSLAGASWDMAESFINSTKDSNYSVIWSLNQNSQVVISNLTLDKNKYFISSWVPQVRLLQHNYISMAILHGGSNGVHEALYYGVPCIILPQFVDQFDWGVRVADAGVGVQLLPHEVTSSSIKETIVRIEAGEYPNKAQKMKMIMRRGGGVTKAADLVEYYGVVGYDHLLAAPIKYKWNWIQYYNVDVCITLVSITLAIVWCIVMVIRYSYRCCCKMFFNSKIKQY